MQQNFVQFYVSVTLTSGHPVYFHDVEWPAGNLKGYRRNKITKNLNKFNFQELFLNGEVKTLSWRFNFQLTDK